MGILERDYPATAAAAELLGVDERAIDVLDRVWTAVLARIDRGEDVASPRAAVLAELLTVLFEEDLLYISDDPADRDVMAGYFFGADDRWAGWWRRDPPMWAPTMQLEPLLRQAIRRLPPLPRAALVMVDVVGLPAQGAADIAGCSTEDLLSMLSAARTETIGLVDESLVSTGGVHGGRGPAL